MQKYFGPRCLRGCCRPRFDLERCSTVSGVAGGGGVAHKVYKAPKRGGGGGLCRLKPSTFCRSPPNGWVCDPGVIGRFALPFLPMEGRVSSVGVFLAALRNSRGWVLEAVMGLELQCTYIYLGEGADARKGREGPTTFAPVANKNDSLGKTRSGYLECFLGKGLRSRVATWNTL